MATIFFHTMGTIPKWPHIKYHTMGTIPKWKKNTTLWEQFQNEKKTTIWKQFQNEKKIPQYGNNSKTKNKKYHTMETIPKLDSF
jgi:hypothetical protein